MVTEKLGQTVSHENAGAIARHVLLLGQGQGRIVVGAFENHPVFAGHLAIEGDDVSGFSVRFGIIPQAELHHLGLLIVDGGVGGKNDMLKPVGVLNLERADKGHVPGAGVGTNGFFFGNAQIFLLQVGVEHLEPVLHDKARVGFSDVVNRGGLGV